ncbi:hypothetical protein EON66_00195 [archaeon]|nr:MAG: hypothetical protein EON66_00195 [archaeon]
MDDAVAGNEPDLLAPWQFAVAGNQYAYLTQYWTRWLIHKYYTTGFDGMLRARVHGRANACAHVLCFAPTVHRHVTHFAACCGWVMCAGIPGNDDFGTLQRSRAQPLCAAGCVLLICFHRLARVPTLRARLCMRACAGTMSAWAAWAYLGLYPIAGTKTYALGSPSFASATFSLPASLTSAAVSTRLDAVVVTLNITAHNASRDNQYVVAAAVNGQPLSTPYVEHDVLFPTLYQPDCASVTARGTHASSSACTAPATAARARAATGTASVLEFWMSATPQTFGPPPPSAAGQPGAAPKW